MGGFITQPYIPPVKKSSFLISLVALVPNANSLLKQKIPASDDNFLNIAYYQSPFIVQGDVLAAFIQATFNLTDLQMTSLFANSV